MHNEIKLRKFKSKLLLDGQKNASTQVSYGQYLLTYECETWSTTKKIKKKCLVLKEE